MKSPILTLLVPLVTYTEFVLTVLVHIKQTSTVISGRLPAVNLLILHETRATAGNREVRVM